MNKLPAQFAHDNVDEAEFQQTLMSNAVVVYESVKENPGIKLINGTDHLTALTLQAAGLLEEKDNKWFVTGRDALQVAYPKKLIEGGLYHIWSRNFNLGVHKDGGFIGIREKIGYRFLEWEHRFRTKEYLEQCPQEIYAGRAFNAENTALFNWLKKKEIQYGSKIE